MGIGDVFAKAWELWRRDVGWLILAGLVVGLIMMVVFGIAFGIFAAIFAGAGLTIGVDLANDATSSLTGLGVGLIVLGFIVYLVAVFVLQVISLTFYGGMFEMVIGAARENRGIRFGDLFSGFRKFGAYALFALVMFGISIGVSVVNVIPLIGWLVGMAVSIWIYVLWLYVLPLIADQGLGFGEAAGRSNAMVKGVGWWKTFGMVIVLGLVMMAAVVVIVLVAVGIGQAEEWAGIAVGILLFLVFAILVPPYTICYVSVMYLGSGGAVAPVPGGGLPGVPPAPPAPMAPAGYGTPASPTMAAPAAGAATAVTAPGAPPAPPPAADAWKAAADPLASPPPAPPVVPAAAGQPAAQPPAPGPATPATADEAQAATAADDDATAGTGAAPATAPEPPEPPEPPAPPV